MSHPVTGIHHVTAITGDLNRNLAFYHGVLGLRLVKRTVNFDDPGSLHLYFGDESGRPGTILTFFVWPGARRGRQGTGQVGELALAIPPEALGYWTHRLLERGIQYEGPERRFDEQVLRLQDPDGLLIELVTSPVAAQVAGWSGGPVPAESAIRGVHAVTIWEDGDQGTEALLTGSMGLRRIAEEGNRIRLAAPGPIGGLVDLRRVTGFWRGSDGAGAVHHVAFRLPDDEAELAARGEIEAAGLRPTPPIDREYFHSVYFREPGGVLFELATDPPGFTRDEPLESLGTTLRLPPWLEPQREEIERAVPSIDAALEAIRGPAHAG